MVEGSGFRGEGSGFPVQGSWRKFNGKCDFDKLQIRFSAVFSGGKISVWKAQTQLLENPRHRDAFPSPCLYYFSKEMMLQTSPTSAGHLIR